MAQNLSLGLPHPTLITKLLGAVGLSTDGQEVLQNKNPLNRRAIECIMKTELGGDGGGVSSSQLARKAHVNPTIANVA